MPFSEKLKMEVRRLAAFRCCRCQSIGVEIHHIIPQSEGGPDTIDNAVPLCAKCHADFGANPVKRKELGKRRDWWHAKVSAQYSPIDPRFQAIEAKLDELLKAVRTAAPPIEAIKSNARDFVEVYLEGMNPQNAQTVVSSVVNIEKPPFRGGSPCQMAGQPCPAQACHDGVMDVDPMQEGVVCTSAGFLLGL